LHKFSIEKELWSEGYSYLCGIDEVGRGPLAGPVVAAAVIIRNEIDIPALNDSKKLTTKQREDIYNDLIQKCECFAIGAADEHEIDNLNILNATFLAIQRAVNNLQVKPDFLLIDGNRQPDINFPTRTIIKGDEKCFSIAAASVIAKVVRDHYMVEIDGKYPKYKFKNNKGYATREHIDIVKEIGPSPVHRKSFLRKILYDTLLIPFKD